MVFLLFACLAENLVVNLNAEFEAYAWVCKEALARYDLNVETLKTFRRLGFL
jgi:predicted amino acid dehydrogenase